MKIAVIAPMEPASFYDLLWEGVWEATFDISPFGVEVQNLGIDGLAHQREILGGLLTERVDAIALLPMHATSLNDVIDRHVHAGTPVVTFCSDAPESSRTLFVGSDGEQAGRLAGEILIKTIKGAGRVLSFPGPMDDHQTAQRYAGLQRVLQGHGVHEIASTAESAGFTGLFGRLGPVDGVYAGWDRLAEIAAALEALGLECPCVGFSNTDDVRPFLERGAISAVVDENRYQQGYFAIQKAYEAVTRPTDVSGVRIPCSAVFASNMSAATGDLSLTEAFERLVLQRTESLRSYQRMLEEANAQLANLATTDPLTGLCNRRKFEELLRAEVAAVRRHGPLSLLMIDLNLFKIVNDKYGHQAGDRALQAVAEVLRSRSRSSDSCARLGGDEFAVVMPHTDAAGAAALRAAIQELIAQIKLPVGAATIGLGLSIGTATTADGSVSAEQLVALADEDMYRVKLASRQPNAGNA